MTPHQGSGAGQAVEVSLDANIVKGEYLCLVKDAYILGLLLGHPLTTKATIARALSVYDYIRRPFSQKVQERSRLNGLYFTLCCQEIDFSRIPEHEMLAKLKILGKILSKNWEWAWMSSLGGSVQEALRMIETSE